MLSLFTGILFFFNAQLLLSHLLAAFYGFSSYLVNFLNLKGRMFNAFSKDFYS